MTRKSSTNTAEQTVDPVDALPSVTISGAVPAVLGEAVELHRWQNRKSRADVLNEALADWAEKHELTGPARERLAAQIAESATE